VSEADYGSPGRFVAAHNWRFDACKAGTATRATADDVRLILARHRELGVNVGH
jgi:hypothetical protein